MKFFPSLFLSIVLFATFFFPLRTEASFCNYSSKTTAISKTKQNSVYFLNRTSNLLYYAAQHPENAHIIYLDPSLQLWSQFTSQDKILSDFNARLQGWKSDIWNRSPQDSLPEKISYLREKLLEMQRRVVIIIEVPHGEGTKKVVLTQEVLRLIWNLEYQQKKYEACVERFG